MSEDEFSYFEYFSGYVPSGAAFLVSANDISDCTHLCGGELHLPERPLLNRIATRLGALLKERYGVLPKEINDALSAMTYWEDDTAA
jgi:hypothetical protein